MSKKFTTYATRLIPIFFFVGFSLAFYYLPPESIIGFIGVENAYALIFILALLGGLTTLSGIPYHVVLVALAVGGLNPFFLGLSTAVGVMLGDSTSYYLGSQGRVLLSPRMQSILERLSHLQQKYPRLLPVLFFLYGCIVPFSNDIITIPAGLLGYPFWRVMLTLGLGNLVFNISLAFVAAYAYGILQYLPFI
ncbi:MAG: hypothetical protein A3C84_00760 [Candidatus Ryanbacteria bacterium RIFCSPHIGHO2_02_FULL_48_12]|uniref:VTT domain-containing protein n=1 Tax=Candidatus Ryanbacteria bacterium RIFCSPHIGHO2_01_FULL_48_27 TaxID=1802115 RepID=A0A1G2G7D7_9BACT|nr:MAG: hypothetical protein A2756_02680 [Candidatus Ryanbacteria bacterium RIFCSPHIGHO2_01_FULL_48_27]OGZ49312.1 MAG: hypothetical protein A3C84_00760 [Candidatus Ryanbacteria bacterium RIFCSPHIGHO2_02_FULL_48_12]